MLIIGIIALLGTLGFLFYTDQQRKRRMLSEAKTTYSQHRGNSVRNINDRSIYHDDEDFDDDVLGDLATAAIINEVFNDDGLTGDSEQIEVFDSNENERVATPVAVGDNTPVVDNTPAPSWDSSSVATNPVQTTTSAPSFEPPSNPAPTYERTSSPAPTYGAGSSDNVSDSGNSNSGGNDGGSDD